MKVLLTSVVILLSVHSACASADHMGKSRVDDRYREISIVEHSPSYRHFSRHGWYSNSYSGGRFQYGKTHTGTKSRTRKRVEIYLDNIHLRGKHTIKLKRALKEQYPHIRLQDFQLKKVVLVGKSKHGHGRAFMRIGGWESDFSTVGGTPDQFSNPSRGSFDRITFWNSAGLREKGPWQLGLKGNMKLKKVVVILDQVHSGGDGGHERLPKPGYSNWILRQS